MYRTIVILFLLLFPCKTWSQILPQEGDKLNYRIIGFSVPPGQPGGKYVLEIAEGNYSNLDSFKKYKTITLNSYKHKVVCEVPDFGKQYTWRIVCKNIDSTKIKGPLYHFSTMAIPEVDTSLFRLRIMKHAEKYSDAYVFSEASRTLYDMNGMPVWFLPRSKKLHGSNDEIYGDFNITNRGTITFIRISNNDEQMYEINYNGDILWESPKAIKWNKDSLTDEKLKGFSDGDHLCVCYSNNICHREFSRLSNGHYMLLESEFRWLKLPGGIDSTFLKRYMGNIRQDNDKVFYQRVNFGKIIEYDANVNEVWSWRSSSYFTGSDVYNHTAVSGLFDVDDAHENAFYYDETAKVIYISFKTINRIVKIEYPSGKILKVYGSLYDQKIPGYINNIFQDQHNCRVTKEGYLSVYNNNDRGQGYLPTLLLLQEPVSEYDSLKKVWEYQCTIEGDTTEKIFDFGAKGSVMELPDGSMLACMTSEQYTKIFIVNRDKKVLWSALPERYDPKSKTWKAINEYRASMIINQKELERMIWKRNASKDLF